MKALVYQRADGGISIVHPAPEFVALHPTEQAAIDKIKAGLTNPVEIDSATLPDRTFRDAWKTAAGKVDVDMPKARAIHMARIRRVRDKELAKLDVAWSRAIAKGVGADVVEAKRQKLRDLPQTFDLTSSTTPEELKVMWPNELP